MHLRMTRSQLQQKRTPKEMQELVQRAQAQAKSITKHQYIGMTGPQP
jgi:hypothetical protein